MYHISSSPDLITWTPDHTSRLALLQHCNESRSLTFAEAVVHVVHSFVHMILWSIFSQGAWQCRSWKKQDMTSEEKPTMTKHTTLRGVYRCEPPWGAFISCYGMMLQQQVRGHTPQHWCSAVVLRRL